MLSSDTTVLWCEAASQLRRPSMNLRVPRVTVGSGQEVSVRPRYKYVSTLWSSRKCFGSGLPVFASGTFLRWAWKEVVRQLHAWVVMMNRRDCWHDVAEFWTHLGVLISCLAVAPIQRKSLTVSSVGSQDHHVRLKACSLVGQVRSVPRTNT